MSGISVIRRYFNDSVNIVTILTSDSLSTVGAAGYLTAQAANIAAANEGAWTWLANDTVLVSASDGNALFSVSSNFNSLISNGVAQVSIVNLTEAQFEAIYATPLALTVAPAAGSVNVVDKVYIILNYGTTQYTSGGAIGVQYGSTVNGGGEAASATLAAATVNGATASTIYELAGVSSILVSGAAGEALYLSNASNAFATGDSTFQVLTYYRNIQS